MGRIGNVLFARIKPKPFGCGSTQDGKDVVAYVTGKLFDVMTVSRDPDAEEVISQFDFQECQAPKRVSIAGFGRAAFQGFGPTFLHNR
jgi:hypothetical protein